MSTNPLRQNVQYLPGGGERRGELLARLGIHTVEELLWHLPRELLDLTEVRDPTQLVEDQVQTVRGKVVDTDARQLKQGRTLTATLLDCGVDFVRGLWFNQPWMRQKFSEGQLVLFSGKPKRHDGRWEFAHPRVQWLDEDDDQAHGGLLPKYGLTEGLKQHEMRRLARHAATEFADAVPELLPAAFRDEIGIPVIGDALRGLHAPGSLAAYEAGRRRVLLQDLLEFQLALAMRRRAWRQAAAAPRLPCTAQIDARIRRLFPFQLTPGQNQAIREITADLAADRPMHRLLQAEVGAGKTAVAVYALLVAAAAGFQSVLMAPTELLATQHWHTLQQLLSHSALSRVLLTGNLTAAERRDALDQIRSGETRIVVGTQALIQEDVSFPRLGLAIVDEQHRFGVAQRSRFAGPDGTPHVLVMTATPIPRSLCLTQFGDLDLTMIRDVPPGRRPVVTHRVHSRAQQQKAWEFIRRQLRAGRQGYVICPRVSTESPGARDAAAVEVSEYLQRTELAGLRVGLAHGQMDRAERARVMEQFREGETDLLVATTVVEVGIDVPNATLMVVLQAERYGLAQLHQLRGRTARGAYQGYFFLFSESTAPDALERLGALESMTDGFAIAEKDFELRGPGDVLGTRQHGELPLRVADLLRDRELLDEARTVAFGLIDGCRFDAPEFAPLKQHVLDRFGKLFDLPQSG